MSNHEETPPVPQSRLTDRLGVRELPEQVERVENGPLRFGDDWCGVFIRGDSAFFFAMNLRALIEDQQDVMTKSVMLGLLEMLEASDERRHTPNV